MRPFEPMSRDDLAEALLAGSLRSELRVEVPSPFVRGAHVAQEEVEDGLVEAPAFVQLDRRDDDALLDQLFGQRHRARRDASDVRVMGAGGDEADEGTPQEYGRDHRDIGEVGTAKVGVVQDDDVARSEPFDSPPPPPPGAGPGEGPEKPPRNGGGGGRGGGGNGAEVDGNMRRLRDEPPRRVEDRA